MKDDIKAISCFGYCFSAPVCDRGRLDLYRLATFTRNHAITLDYEQCLTGVTSLVFCT